MTSHPTPRVRVIDRTRWFPFAWINEAGAAVAANLPVADFLIAVYTRNALMRMMRK